MRSLTNVKQSLFKERNVTLDGLKYYRDFDIQQAFQNIKTFSKISTN